MDLMELIESDPLLNDKNSVLSEQEREKLKNWMHNYDPAYFDGLCKRREGFLRTLVDEMRIDEGFARDGDEPRPGNLMPVFGRQCLHLSNHKSHFDYLIQLSNLYNKGVTMPRTGGKDSVFFWPFTKVWKKCGAFKIPAEMTSHEVFLLNLLVRATVRNGDGLWIYPEGMRSTDGKLKPFKTAGLKMIYNAAKEFDKKMLVVPHFIDYDRPIEGWAYPTLTRLKKYPSMKRVYQAIDLSTFALRYLRGCVSPTGKVIHAIGPPFEMSECKSGEDLRMRAQYLIKELGECYGLNGK